ncbi:MAG: hypothetical protein FWE46_01700 [Coriobacteriia bacterium]|nr:hypothetical protein [Coriobacteriia bacterium]MCL2537292.1 hypothetical protein [Coriobacteriia bacterium]
MSKNERIVIFTTCFMAILIAACAWAYDVFEVGDLVNEPESQEQYSDDAYVLAEKKPSVVMPINEEFVSNPAMKANLRFRELDLQVESETIELDIYPGQLGGEIVMETLQDQVVVQVKNGSSRRSNLMLIILYNYQMVDFRVSGAEGYSENFLFGLDPQIEVDIPLQIASSVDSDLAGGRLTVALIISPERHAATDSEIRWDSGRILNLVVDYGFEDSVQIDHRAFEKPRESEFLAFSVHPEEEPHKDGVIPSFGNGDTWEVASGDRVELSFFANAHITGLSDVESYLIITMLGWNQLKMSDQPFLFVDNGGRRNDLNSGQFGRFEVVAPEAPGFYEFFALLMPNPFCSNPYYNLYPPERVRFTVEVIE